MKKLSIVLGLLVLVFFLGCDDDGDNKEVVVEKNLEVFTEIYENIEKEFGKLKEDSKYLEAKLEELQKQGIIDSTMIEDFDKMQKSLDELKDEFGDLKVEDLEKSDEKILTQMEKFEDLKANFYEMLEKVYQILLARGIDDENIKKTITNKNTGSNSVLIITQGIEDNDSLIKLNKDNKALKDSLDKVNQEKLKQLEEAEKKEAERLKSARQGEPMISICYDPKLAREATIPFGLADDNYCLKTGKKSVKRKLEKHELDITFTFSINPQNFDEEKKLLFEVANNEEMSNPKESKNIEIKGNAIQIVLGAELFDFGQIYYFNLEYENESLIKGGKPRQIKIDISPNRPEEN